MDPSYFYVFEVFSSSGKRPQLQTRHPYYPTTCNASMPRASSSMAPVLSKPQHLQADSLLCQLPPEIRLIILREFLRFPDSTDSNEGLCEYWDILGGDTVPPKDQRVSTVVALKDRIRSGLYLSQTCRLLHREAMSIFYKENVLKLRVTSSMIICSLPGVVAGLEDAFDGPLLRNGLEELGKAMCWMSFTDGKIEHESVTKAYNIFKHFDRFSLEFWRMKGDEISDPLDLLVEWVGRACRILQQTLWMKQVDLVFTGPFLDLFDDDCPLLATCKILRCASLSINGQPAPLVVAEYVSGSAEVSDTYQQLVDTRYRMARNPVIHPAGEYRFEVAYSEELRELEVPALLYDQSAFSHALQVFLHEAYRWSNAWLDGFEQQRRALSNIVRVTDEVLVEDVIANFYDELGEQERNEPFDAILYAFPWDE